MSVHGLELNNNQFISAQIWIQNGPDEEMNIIEFGWMVYPALFGDSRNLIFGYWTAYCHKQTGFFNVLCSGFVQIHSDASLSAALEPVSVYGKDTWYTPFKVYQVYQVTFQGIPGKCKTPFKVYQEIFTHLANNASMVRFGGIAGVKPQMPAPPMGNGYLPQFQDYLKTAHITKMKYVNEEGQDVKLIWSTNEAGCSSRLLQDFVRW
ncbi:uncharacterized protein LOC113359268 [Papaver somniferum]|uniref:uncharacterized protein LOC113359268 n=1 Tax=Papaver somniferum TaxID=3469 RepID=UPI000E6FA6C2|nr:uncharacterized protein LOC113359268 [Papaver somniferum]